MKNDQMFAIVETVDSFFVLTLFVIFNLKSGEYANLIKQPKHTRP